MERGFREHALEVHVTGSESVTRRNSVEQAGFVTETLTKSLSDDFSDSLTRILVALGQRLGIEGCATVFVVL